MGEKTSALSLWVPRWCWWWRWNENSTVWLTKTKRVPNPGKDKNEKRTQLQNSGTNCTVIEARGGKWRFATQESFDALVLLGCNRIPYIHNLQTTELYFTLLETGQSIVWWLLGPHTAGTGEGTLGDHQAHSLRLHSHGLIAPRPHSPKPSHWGLGFNIWILEWGHKHSGLTTGSIRLFSQRKWIQRRPSKKGKQDFFLR